MRRQAGIKSQDILLVLKMVSLGHQSWRQLDLANALGISQAGVVHSLDRLRFAGLIDDAKQKPLRLALVEFLIHGLKYVFPAELGGIARGIPTAHAYGLLGKRLVENTLPYVWPSEHGEVRGQVLVPLYKSVPFAVQTDASLHELLALVDALRVGRARDREMAAKQLEKLILKKGAQGKLLESTSL